MTFCSFPLLTFLPPAPFFWLTRPRRTQPRAAAAATAAEAAPETPAADREDEEADEDEEGSADLRWDVAEVVTAAAEEREGC